MNRGPHRQVLFLYSSGTTSKNRKKERKKLATEKNHLSIQHKLRHVFDGEKGRVFHLTLSE